MRIVELERELCAIEMEYCDLERYREELDYDKELKELNFQYDTVVEELVKLYKEELKNIKRQMDELCEFQNEWDKLDFDYEMSELDIREYLTLKKMKRLIG